MSLTLLTLSVMGQDLCHRNASQTDGLAFIKKTMPPERLVWLDHSILNLPHHGSINSLALNKEGAPTSNAFHPIHLINTHQEKNLLNYSHMKHDQTEVNLTLASPENESFLKNRRNVYSAMWAFASLNYIYADLVGVMDVNKLLQYQTGVVEGLKITPEFLTVAAGFMQIPIANVVLPHIIKNEKPYVGCKLFRGPSCQWYNREHSFLENQPRIMCCFLLLKLQRLLILPLTRLNGNQIQKNRR